MALIRRYGNHAGEEEDWLEGGKESGTSNRRDLEGGTVN